MDDVQRALGDAWARIRPRLQQHPHELARRLERRHLKLIDQPPRAWCMAIRATDTRLDRYLTSYPNRRAHAGHDVLIDPGALRRLCAPVYIPRPGLLLKDLAKLLGTTPHNLLDARLAGVFQSHHLPPGVHASKPRPLLYTALPLDPSARSFAAVDPLWSITAPQLLPGRIPQRFRQRLRRVPLWQGIGPGDVDPASLHPEHPKRLRTPAPPKCLPPPDPDYVWYKWRDGEPVEHDWRSPRAAANHHAHQSSLRQARDASRRRRLENPPPSRWSGSLQFRGWRWRCPRCGRMVNLLYLPLPRIALIDFKKLEALAGAALPKPPRNRFFACRQCHRVKHISHIDYKGWNELVTYLSAGMLYGHEVARPAWYTPRRSINHTPRPGARPSVRRPQIERGLLAGKTIRTIADEIGLSFGTVLWYAQRIYPLHGVGCLKELLRKYGLPSRPGLRGKGLGKRGEGRVRRHRSSKQQQRQQQKQKQKQKPAVLRTSAN